MFSLDSDLCLSGAGEPQRGAGGYGTGQSPLQYFIPVFYTCRCRPVRCGAMIMERARTYLADARRRARRVARPPGDDRTRAGGTWGWREVGSEQTPVTRSPHTAQSRNDQRQRAADRDARASDTSVLTVFENRAANAVRGAPPRPTVARDCCHVACAARTTCAPSHTQRAYRTAHTHRHSHTHTHGKRTHTHACARACAARGAPTTHARTHITCLTSSQLPHG